MYPASVELTKEFFMKRHNIVIYICCYMLFDENQWKLDTDSHVCLTYAKHHCMCPASIDFSNDYFHQTPL